MFRPCYGYLATLRCMTSSAPQGPYPGERLGLPATGPGSIARVGRRFAALAIDWAAAVLVSVAFFAYDAVATLTIFAIVQVLLIPTLGGSAGHWSWECGWPPSADGG